MIIAMLSAVAAAAPSITAQPAAPAAPTCAVDTARMIQLTYEDFDQNPSKGWRSVSRRPECRVAAADLIREYRTANWGKLLPHQLHLNYWHEGQLRAFGAQVDRAIPLLLAGANPDSIDGFPHYAMATVAFLQRDLAALRAARVRLAALPEATWFKEAKTRGQIGKDMKWPPNLDVVDGLIACFDKPYSEAYGHPNCRPR